MAKIPANECRSPYFAYKKDNQWRIKRGSCNRWECERCQHFVASQHYGRIVRGAELLTENDQNNLWFITVTCKGKELSINEATNSYTQWTNHLLTLMRQDAKSSGQNWHYCQVTELQKRGMPHSHILTTYKPSDAAKRLHLQRNGEKYPETDGWYVETKYRSLLLQKMAIQSGLGHIYDLSLVKEPKAASRYVAKYMFKDSQFEAEFPRNWNRVRYSQSWPKLPEYETDALPLVRHEDWLNLASLAVSVSPDRESLPETVRMLRNTNVVVRLPRTDE